MKTKKNLKAASAQIAVQALCTFIYAFLAIGTLLIVTQDTETQTMIPCTVNCEVGGPSTQVTDTIKDMETGGLSCSKTASLTDTIVFEDRAGNASTITFDEALAKSEAGAGWIRSYCV